MRRSSSSSLVFVCLFWTQFLCTSANIPTRNVANQARDGGDGDGGESQADNSTWSSYGVDVSFPIFHSVSTNYPWLPQNNNTMPLQPLGNRHKLYQDHLNACREIYNTGNDDDNDNNDDNHDNNWCDQHEYMRMMMNLRQPASMVNYTKRGFQKIKAPTQLTKLIAKFWKQNHYKGQEEIWPQGNTFVNHWYGSIISLGQKQKNNRVTLFCFVVLFHSRTHTHTHSLSLSFSIFLHGPQSLYIYTIALNNFTHTHTHNESKLYTHTHPITGFTHTNREAPTYMISVDDQGLRGSGPELKRQIWEASAATLEEWTEQELQPCSLYGIRVYGEGSIMLPHVDRLPLVVSAMIPVAQQVDEPWPLEVYDHDGQAHNITMEPGELFLFESSSVIHGMCLTVCCHRLLCVCREREDPNRDGAGSWNPFALCLVRKPF